MPSVNDPTVQLDAVNHSLSLSFAHWNMLLPVECRPDGPTGGELGGNNRGLVNTRKMLLSGLYEQNDYF
jgi:hypothetical protein